MHPAALEVDELLKVCTVTRGRGSGPGGQHRNKVETAVAITHDPTGIQGWAAERRSQEENRKVALRRLRMKLAIEHRQIIERCYAPTDLWRSRCADGKVVISERHADLPAVLAEAMDVLADRSWEPAKAAAVLDCTTSQLVKLLKKEPAALAKVHAERQRIGRGAVR